MAQLTEVGREFLERGSPLGVPEGDNPFVREGRRTFLRYDGISLEPADGGGVMWALSWRGRRMWYLRQEADGFTVEGGTLALRGLEGRIEVFIAD